MIDEDQNIFLIINFVICHLNKTLSMYVHVHLHYNYIKLKLLYQFNKA